MIGGGCQEEWVDGRCYHECTNQYMDVFGDIARYTFHESVRCQVFTVSSFHKVVNVGSQIEEEKIVVCFKLG